VKKKKIKTTKKKKEKKKRLKNKKMKNQKKLYFRFSATPDSDLYDILQLVSTLLLVLFCPFF